MQRRITLVLGLMVLAGLLLPALPVTAASNQPDDGVVIWSQDYTLAAGEQLDGNLVIFNGDAVVERRSRVRGNVVVWNGNADVDGIIEGNVVASNGDVLLRANGVVRGDVVCSWNCRFTGEGGSRVEGDVIHGPTLRATPFRAWTTPPFPSPVPMPNRRPVWLVGIERLLIWAVRTVRLLITIVVVAAMGGLVAVIWPAPTAQVTRTAFEWPGASVGIGFLTLLAAAALMAVLAITICLSPIAALLAVALGLAGFFGWVAIGAGVGRRLLTAAGAGEVAPLWVGGLGTLIITLLTLGLSRAFCLAPLGWVLTVVIGSAGLGAVVLTRFGTTPYVPGRTTRTPPPPPPAPEAPPQPPGPPPDAGLVEPPVSEADAGDPPGP